MSGLRASIGVALVAIAGAAALSARPATTPAAPPIVPRAAAAPATPAPRLATGAKGAPTAPAPAVVTRVVSAPWGSGDGELGRARPAEGSPEGPMSFVVDAAGRVTVLDQVNERLVTFDDGRASAVPVPGRTAQDLAATPTGFVLLDRLVRRALAFVDARGRLSHEVPLVGVGVPEGGGVTGVFQRPDGTWVEVEHARLVRVADADGRATNERTMVLGRFVGDAGARVTARREGASIELGVTEPGRGTRAIAIDLGAPIARISGLEGTSLGHLFVSAVTRPAPSTPDEPAANAHVVALVDAASSRLLSRHEVPAQDEPEETMRAARLGDDGAYYTLRCASSGAEIWKVLP
jgi:hypothetical protein